jgi:hypothetical protein
VEEARAHLAVAEGRPAEAVEFLHRADRLYSAAGHGRAAERCATAVATVSDSAPLPSLT